MPATYCIPKPTADILISAIKKGDAIGKIDLLFDMTSEQRRNAFAKHVGQTTAQQINAEFEKALNSNKQTALKDWAKNTFSAEQKKETRFKSAIEKIEELDAKGLLDKKSEKDFLQDLVMDRLGISITPKEAETISKKTRALSEAFKKPAGAFGPDMAYWEAKRDLDNYLDSLTPSSKLKVFTSIISRGTMLASFKSPLVNIESNTVNAITEATARRIEDLKGVGFTGNKHAKSYMKYVRDVFRKTGYDVSRMMSFQDGRKSLGEDVVHAQGKGLTRKIGQFYTDIVFNKLMTTPDVMFASWHLADSANIYANAIAKSEGLRGKEAKSRVEEIFLDATQIEPKTKEGQQVREKAVLEAQRGTYTNKNNFSKTALGIRKVLNDFSSDLRLGDNLMPFVQVPATVVEAGVDYSGIGLPINIFSKLIEVRNARKRGDHVKFRDMFDRTFIRKIVRAGIGNTVAMILSSWFDPDEFIGEYPTSSKEQELLKLKNAKENSVKIGDKWISLDYLGPLAGSFVGMMYAKKYGNTPLEKVMRFYQGAGMQVSRIPGFQQFYDIYNTLQDLNPSKTSPEDLKERGFKYVVDFFRARTVPAILSDLAKGTDPYVRNVDKYDALGQFVSNIPHFRENLPIKKDIFGEDIKGEGFWSSIFFGSRVKDAKQDQIVTELSRLAETNQLPSVTDVSKTSPRAKELKVQIGDQQFEKFQVSFGNKFKKGIEKEISKGSYKKLSDEDKKKSIDKIKNEIFDTELKRFHYKPPKKKK